METMLTSAIGLLAASLMFCGDMLLYFTTEELTLDGTLKPYVAIMKKLPDWRLKFGGLLGPIAAFLYCIGFLHYWLVTVDHINFMGLAATLFGVFGMIVGGAYHSHFTYIGLIGKTESEAGVQAVCENTMLLSKISLGALLTSIVLFAGLVAFGQTIYPRWFVVLTPAFTLFLIFFWTKLPQPFRIILLGGWYNLIFVIFFVSSLLFLG